ncbi:MAG TPA: glycosyltransferase family 4 protein [Thermoanaerobaculia bacterium]
MRTRILLVLAWYLPGFRGGGSIRTVANLIEYLGDQYDFLILTSDRDWRSSAPYDGIRTGEWTQVGKARVRYLEPREWSLRRLARLMRSVPYDVLYLNSLFSPDATIRPLLLRRFGALPSAPVILGPRGELAPGAMSTSTWKKRAWLAAARALRLLRGILWQASTAAESADIRRALGDVEIAEALDCSPDYRDWPGYAVRAPKAPGRARICFVSRIAPVKNVEFALRLFEGMEGDVTLDLYGPIDHPEYWARCESVIAALPPNVRVAYRGAVEYADLGHLLATYDLFLLPTLGENFGHTILEALAAGCPVLVSDRTPWRDLEASGVGWDVPLDDAEAFRRALRTVIAMDEPLHAELRHRARTLALRCADPALAIEQNRALFEHALRLSPQSKWR